jgi:iron complex transport system substrate-binding protein
LQVRDAVVGVTIYCPEIAADKQKIGTLLEPNIEKIVALHPDLVIATKDGNRKESIARLEGLGIKVYVMNPYGNFDALCADFNALGAYLDKKAEAEKVIASARKRIAAVEKKAAAQKKFTVFWQIGVQPLFTVSRGSFSNEFIERAGGRNIFGSLVQPYPRISREAVIQKNPDVIFLVAMGDVSRQEEKEWQQYPQLSAVQHHRIYTLSDTLFTDPTPASISDGVEYIAGLLWGYNEK